MKKRFTYIFTVVAVLSVMHVTSCKKEKEEFTNPYDDPSLKKPATVSTLEDIDPSNFAYLQNKIFQPHCAQSGCHDGTFPPDYRTISSTYNTLIYQKPVNTASDQFRFRVFPFKADSSILYHRMTVPMGSGIMPIDYSVNDDWIVNEETYITAIKNWINAGAKDMFDNYPKQGNLLPTITGFVAFPAGNTSSAYSRGGGNISAIEVPANSSVDLWFLINDDSTAVSQITDDTCKLSTSIISFVSASNSIISYDASGVVANDFLGNASTYYHKTTISTSGYLPGEDLYIRAYINDNSQASAAEIPNTGSSTIFLGYFALKIQ